MSEHIYEDSSMEHENYYIIPFGWQREEIVRCRDCKWMSKDTVHYKACYRLHAIEFMVEPDGFCAWGERRERESAEVWNQWSADDVTCSEES